MNDSALLTDKEC